MWKRNLSVIGFRLKGLLVVFQVFFLTSIDGIDSFCSKMELDGAGFDTF